jgi:3-methyladenine DNA glycosylase AlkC
MPDALKDTLYSRESFDEVVSVLQGVYPVFDRTEFLSRLFDEAWENRSLMERMRHIPKVLRQTLPQDYRTALEILMQAASLLRNKGFHVIGFTEFVPLYGLDDLDASLPALAHFTQYGSAEFAVRPFILRDTPRLMAQLLAWAGDANEHVRRLASEGCRPRLPWGVALTPFKNDPSPILPILERLKNDPSEYVRRSVANNLNDIAKDNPQVVIDVLRRWQSDADANVQWITSRALRTLVKSGHTEALALLGYSDGAQVTVRSMALDRETVAVGESISFCAEVESTGSQTQSLVIDYVVYYMKANGRQAAKVFKLAKREMQPGEVTTVQKKVSFKPITTRVYYPGEHAVALKINGKEMPRLSFMLVM